MGICHEEHSLLWGWRGMISQKSRLCKVHQCPQILCQWNSYARDGVHARALCPSLFRSLVLSFSRSLVLSFSRSLVLSFSRSLSFFLSSLFLISLFLSFSISLSLALSMTGRFQYLNSVKLPSPHRVLKSVLDRCAREQNAARRLELAEALGQERGHVLHPAHVWVQACASPAEGFPDSSVTRTGTCVPHRTRPGPKTCRVKKLSPLFSPCIPSRCRPLPWKLQP